MPDNPSPKIKDNILAIKNPELAKQWHPTKNATLTPNNFTTQSHKKVWWVCEKGHEWEASIAHRTNGRGCPYCSGKLVCIDNCLKTLNPELARQWHITKNGDLTPNEVTIGSSKKVWWQCEKGHEWEAIISNRSKGYGCPYCLGKYACDDNCLQTVNPNLAEQWHPDKNGDLTPNNVTNGSGKKVWWRCEKGHEWQAVILSRSSGTGCPVCSNESKTSFPEQAIYFYLKEIFNDTINRYRHNSKWEIDVFVPSLNFGIEYDGIYYHKDKKSSEIKKEKHISDEGILFLRVKEIEEKIMNCYCKENIIYCNNAPTETHLDEVITMCFDYISDNATNKSCVVDINVKRDRAKIYDLYIKGEKERSLIAKYPNIARQWHPNKNENLTPNNVSAGSHKNVWWLCEKGHEWTSNIYNRIKGVGCPYCAGKLACKDNCLQALNPELAEQWHPIKNGI